MTIFTEHCKDVVVEDVLHVDGFAFVTSLGLPITRREQATQLRRSLPLPPSLSLSLPCVISISYLILQWILLWMLEHNKGKAFSTGFLFSCISST